MKKCAIFSLFICCFFFLALTNGCLLACSMYENCIITKAVLNEEVVKWIWPNRWYNSRTFTSICFKVFNPLEAAKILVFFFNRFKPLNSNSISSRNIHDNLKFMCIFYCFFIGIIIPGPWSKETMLLLLIAASLVARSASDIWMIQSVTIIESTIIQMDRRKFLNTLFKYCTALPLVRFLSQIFLSSIIFWSRTIYRWNNRFFLLSQRFQWWITCCDGV